MKKIVGIAGWSGSGKTTLVEGLIKTFKKNHSLSIGVLKHAHKNFKIDIKGKDSYRFSEAGANKILLSSENQWVTINNSLKEEKSLEFLLKETQNLDIVLVEGWKYSNLNKIEVYRKEINKEFLHPRDNNILAIALEDLNITVNRNIIKLDLNNYFSIAKFILENDFEFNYD